MPKLKKYGIEMEDMEYIVGQDSSYWGPRCPYEPLHPQRLWQAVYLLESYVDMAENKAISHIIIGLWNFITESKSFVETKEPKPNLWLTAEGVKEFDLYGDVDIDSFYPEMGKVRGAWRR